ncbi:hypothetical protein PG299_02545 [Riemerella anatipestifer]|nr:hypothetical protein [Riemerella anatipestifer]
MKFTLLYSKKGAEKDSIYLRHRFSLNGKAREIKLKTKFSIYPEYWDNYNECWDTSLKVRTPRKAEDKLRNSEIDNFNAEFSAFKLKIQDFLAVNPYPTKDMLKEVLFDGVNIKPHFNTEYPILFSDFVDFYIEQKKKLIPGKQKPISKRSIQRFIQIKSKINKFYPRLKITEINDAFRDEYSFLMMQQRYKDSFIIKELKFIKTFCKYANKKLDINKEVLYWEFKNTEIKKYDDPIFSFEELDILAKLELPDRLDNARDWLIISCYTGQRVSDLLNMDSRNIIDNEFYSLHQQKGQKDIVLWLMPPVIDILNKREKEFPRKISSQKYNNYIKEVCEIAGFDELLIGGKYNNKTKRKEIGEYPKHELITSHIGRRTFVSLFQGILGQDNTMTQTGHTSVNMLNLYNKTKAIDKARKVKDAYNNSIIV